MSFNFELTQDQRAMVGTVRELSQDLFKPNALKYMDGTFPWENMRELAKIGVLGMAVPEEYGGLGLPVLDTALVLEEIAKGCYVTAMARDGRSRRAVQDPRQLRAGKHQARLLPGVCTADTILAVCMTEPHAGTDVANYRTNTDIVGDKLVMNGVKTLISRVDEAQAFVVFSRINKHAGPRRHRLRPDRARTRRDSSALRAITRWAARTSPRSSSTTASCRWRT